MHGKRMRSDPRHLLEVLWYDCRQDVEGLRHSYLVFVEQVLGAVGDPASIVLDAKCMLGPLWGCKAWMLNQPCPQCVGQVLHHNIV